MFFINCVFSCFQFILCANVFLVWILIIDLYLEMNKEFSQKLIVQAAQTAEQLGSGLLPVYSTPSLVAFMENTAMQLIELPEGGSSVGTSISVKHLKASKIGEELTCVAELTENEGRRYAFEIKVTDSKGDLVGEAQHERFVVDVQRFMSKLNS